MSNNADKLYEDATGAKKVESINKDMCPLNDTGKSETKSVRQKIVDNAPAFKRGVDNIISGLIKKAKEANANTDNNFAANQRNFVEREFSSGYQPFNPFEEHPVKSSIQKESKPKKHIEKNEAHSEQHIHVHIHK